MKEDINTVVASVDGKCVMIDIKGEVLDCSPMRTQKQVRMFGISVSSFAMFLGFWIGWGAHFLFSR